MKKLLKFLLYFFVAILILTICTLTTVDRTPPNEQDHYTKMMNRMDSLGTFIQATSSETFSVGFSKVSITPDSTMALAGYGARRPKEYEDILDSVFVRTIVLKTPTKRVAIISADLLIIHPKMTQALQSKLEQIGWNRDEVFLTAIHSHSSIGQWAPGLVGGLFAGEYEERVAGIIADRMLESLLKASENVKSAAFGFSQSENPDLVHNRLAQEEGIEDPNLKNLIFKTEKGKILFSAFSAHATCLTTKSHSLSADFPGFFHQEIDKNSSFLFSLYAAGPVGSMGPQTPNLDQFERTKYLGKEVAKRVTGPDSFSDSITIRSFRIPIELGKPQFKIDPNIALRPYLFNYAFGNEKAEISVLQLGKKLIIGTPCDFSGELAIPLYEYAKQRGFELIITSFNGGYIGYITEDKWYDMKKYETLTMNWYGPGNGAYFSEVIEKIIDAL
jgi:neutral ceramidase